MYQHPQHSYTQPSRQQMRRRAWIVSICVGVVIVFGLITSCGSNTPSSPQAAAVIATTAPTQALTSTPTLAGITPTVKPTNVPTQQPAKPTQAAVQSAQSPAPKPTQPPAKPAPTQPPVHTGVGGNPYGYNFNPGKLIYNPPSDICNYIACIASFWNGAGYVEECQDTMFSLSGGIQGSCSRHGGNLRPLYSH